MTVVFREARHDDVAAVVALLRDDRLGAGREAGDTAHYLAAFDAMRSEGANHLIVGESAGEIVATYQLTFISGLSLTATRRAQIEGVRVASAKRGQGIGAAMIRDAETRARAASCGLLQLMMNKTRNDTHRFYEQHGFVPSHVGFKRNLT